MGSLAHSENFIFSLDLACPRTQPGTGPASHWLSNSYLLRDRNLQTISIKDPIELVPAFLCETTSLIILVLEYFAHCKCHLSVNHPFSPLQSKTLPGTGHII